MNLVETLRVAALVAAGSLMIACAKHPAPAAAPGENQARKTTETRDATPAAGPAAEHGASGKSVRDAGVDKAGPAKLAIGPDVAKPCKLAERPVELALGENARQDRAKLRRLADCLNLPPLNQVAIKLVERASAKGQASAGEEAAALRAKRIRDILLDNGIAAERITVSPTDAEETRGDAMEDAPARTSQADVMLVAETSDAR